MGIARGATWLAIISLDNGIQLGPADIDATNRTHYASTRLRGGPLVPYAANRALNRFYRAGHNTFHYWTTCNYFVVFAVGCNGLMVSK